MTTATTSTYETIMSVNLADVPVMANDRSIRRKEQAALARKLFRSLGITGVSVTTPNYSMANGVDVIVKEDPFSWEGFEQWENETFSSMPDHVPAKIANTRKYEASQKLKKILEVAFPSHDDRSHSISDYYDSKWSIQ